MTFCIPNYHGCLISVIYFISATLSFFGCIISIHTYLYNNNHNLTAPFGTGYSPRGVWYLVGKHFGSDLWFLKKKFKLGHGPPVAPKNVFWSLHKVYLNGHFEHWFIKMICRVGQINNSTLHKPNITNPYDPLRSPNTSKSHINNPNDHSRDPKHFPNLTSRTPNTLQTSY